MGFRSASEILSKETMMRHHRIPAFILALSLACVPAVPAAANQAASDDATKILDAFHGISSHALLEYVKELASDKYEGRLTGTPSYDACTEWTAALLKAWGVKPAGGDGTYFQTFPNPYTVVLPDCEVSLQIPQKNSKDVVKKYYRYEDEFMPGGTSGSGEVTAEVIYVGYGVTAPELGYDDYKGFDVKGKIVLMEREVPMAPDADPALFQKWLPYSYHQYKLNNAVAHGAKGLLYNYGPICNPNNAYSEGFVYAHVGDAVVADVFAGTGKNHEEIIKAIGKTLKPKSFATGKTFTVRTKTVHHPEGIGRNLIAVVEGSDPKLKEEIIVLGAHLDGQGLCPAVMPSANDNATSVAVLLGTAEALARCPVKPKRSVAVILFGAEEQGVAGSGYYIDHPVFPLEKTVAMINLEAAGSGDKIAATIGTGYAALWNRLDKANKTYLHRTTETGEYAFNARPRQDVARFVWKGIPGLTLSSYGYDPGYPTYHNTKDNMCLITPEIMEDLAQMIFMAVMDMGSADALTLK
jgi:hypothetical protein